MLYKKKAAIAFFGMIAAAAVVQSASCSGVLICDEDSTCAQPATAGSGGGGGGTTGIGGTGGTPIDNPPCELTCSNDLSKVVDCYGVEVEKCLDVQACYNAQCIDDPCHAAVLTESSIGCDYWALKTSLMDSMNGACFAAIVSNTWSTPVQINVEYEGQPLDVSQFAYIPKGQGPALTYEPYDATIGLGVDDVAILFLARSTSGGGIDCPKPAAISTEVGVSNTGRGHAFHITTDKPVVAHQFLPYGGGPSHFGSATLLFPTSAWGGPYLAINAYKNGTLDMEASPFLDILAQEDATEVDIIPIAPIGGGPGVESAPANDIKTYHLNKGEFLQIEQPQELTGSPMKSNKPVGVFGGSSCLFTPLNKGGCDPAHQQIPRPRAFGSEYVGVRYRGRGGGAEAEIPWRLASVVDGTKLTWIPPESTPNGAPDTLNLGDVFEFTSPGDFIVKSQDEDHPFYLSEYMTGGEPYNDEGDPEWVNVIPPSQFLSRYVFFTDPTYPETSLVVIRAKSKVEGEGFADVALDCLGGPIPEAAWKDIGDAYQYARVDLVTGAFQGVGGCANGRQVMWSTLPFGVTVWGWGTKATGTELGSYAFPAGANLPIYYPPYI